MNKTELVDAIAAKANVLKVEAERMLNAFIDIVPEVLSSGNEVMLVGFGTFTVSERAGRTGRNPRTGEALMIPAARLPKFKPGKAFKDKINK
jgi:DNA-binding protein HU-beta